MTTYMFPGQGAQIRGMGKDLFTMFPNETKEASSFLGYSIEDLCVNDTHNQLSDTRYTQPALYVVEALTYLDKIKNSHEPDYCIGHSLGEYSALFAAGAYDFLTGLKLVAKRGQLLFESADSQGGMLAVVGLNKDRVVQLLSQNKIQGLEFANINSPKEIVLSGSVEEIRNASNALENEAMMCVPLRVSGAFHSSYMKHAAEDFEKFLSSFQFKNLQKTVIANVNAQPYTTENIKENLVQQITGTVRWSESIQFLKSKGEITFIDIGPGNVLTRLMTQN